MGKKKPCIERLIELGAGGPTEAKARGAVTRTAQMMKTYRGVVANWRCQGYIPANWASRVEEHTGGRITAKEVLEEYEARRPTNRVDHPYAIG